MELGTGFDILLFIVCLASGIFSIVMPEKTWNVLQSRKLKESMEYNERTEKTMRIMGIFLVVVSIVFFAITFIVL